MSIPLASKASGQVTVVDVTDAYSVLLTSESYTFVGNTTGAPSGLSCTTQVVAYCGTQQCSKVTVSTVTCPSGISATISNNNTSSPTITFKTTASITQACEATIPVVVDGVTINKKFSFAVAKQGNTGKSVATLTTNYSYAQSDIDKYSVNGYSGTWACSDTTGVNVGDTILLRVTNTSKNGYSFVIAKVTAVPSSTSVTCTSIGLLDKGDTGNKGTTGKGISSVTPQYYISTSKTSATGGSWSDTAPTTVEKGKYLWTRMKVIYTNPSSTEYTTAAYDSMTDSRIEQLKDSITLEITGPDGVKSSIAMDDEGKIALTGDVMAQRINVEELMAQHLTSTGGLDVTGGFTMTDNGFSIVKRNDSSLMWIGNDMSNTSNKNMAGVSFERSSVHLIASNDYDEVTEGCGVSAFMSGGLDIWGKEIKFTNPAIGDNDANVIIDGDLTVKGTCDLAAKGIVDTADSNHTITASWNETAKTSASWLACWTQDHISNIKTDDVRTSMGITYGSWTPTIYGAAVNSYTSQQGWYLKVGTVVVVGWYLYAKFASGQTSNKYIIQGLPYTPAAAGSGGGVCSGYYSANQVNFSGWYAGRNGRIYGYGITNGAAGNKWAEEKIFCGTGDSYSTGTIIYTTSTT